VWWLTFISGHTGQDHAVLLQTPEASSHSHHFYQQLLFNKQQSPPRELISPLLRGSDQIACELKVVSFPRDCLNRFTSAASINTAQNRETLGLLLGEDKDRLYVVTTLLIPKQHGTSDTCAMDDSEEEPVMQFMEDHSLITLGWVCGRHLRR
jgi:hypothetical protein